MSGLKGDYIGFTFNGIHSSDLGIVRVSEGSRFSENLLPTIQDKTVQIPGGDGTHFFGSYYTSRQFNISFAFDSLTEAQFARIKRYLGDKKIHDLIFDELPYKVYSAKITGSATIKHIPFAEGETNRVYKGEGTIQFTAYEPYARSRYKFLNQYEDENVNEWQQASGMKEEQGNIDVLIDNKIQIYNPGDKESNFSFKINFVNGSIPASGLVISDDREGKVISSIYFDEIRAKIGKNQTEADSYVKIDSKLNLIEGYNRNGIKTGNVYNASINSGFFFKIPQINEDEEVYMNVVVYESDSKITDEGYLSNKPLEYSYYYL